MQESDQGLYYFLFITIIQYKLSRYEEQTTLPGKTIGGIRVQQVQEVVINF